MSDVARNFESSLIVGKAFEAHCRDLLGREGHDSRDQPYPEAPWDFEFEHKSKWFKVECKHDVKAKDTGNLYFETECFGKPSGIMKPEPDYWMHGWLRGPVLLFRRDKLLAYLEEWKTSRKAKPVGGGDDASSRGYIVPVNVAFLAADKDF
jgi:hypothetical protein